MASNADESIIATGGGDGGIRLWPVKDEVEQESEQQHWSSSIPSEYEAGTLASKENPRMIGMLLDTSVLVLTDTGYVHVSHKAIARQRSRKYICQAYYDVIKPLIVHILFFYLCI